MNPYNFFSKVVNVFIKDRCTSYYEYSKIQSQIWSTFFCTFLIYGETYDPFLHPYF